jgi:hypothetical protein
MTTKAALPIVLPMLVLAFAGCAVRLGVTPAEATPMAVPRSAPQAAPSHVAAPERAVAAKSNENSQAPPAPARLSPEPTPSGYVFSPEQAVAARPPSTLPEGAPHERSVSAQRDPAPLEPLDETAETTPGELRLVAVASAPVIASGAIVTVDVMASSSSPVVDAPLHLTFDPTILEFIDGAPGDFLTQGGSSIVFLADGSSRPGDVAVAVGRVERERGASGTGLLCRVRFRAVGAGTTPVLVGDARVWGVRGEALTVLNGRTRVVVH